MYINVYEYIYVHMMSCPYLERVLQNRVLFNTIFDY